MNGSQAVLSAGERLTHRLLVAAAIAGASGVILGAFAAHGLEDFLDRQGVSPELIPKRLAQFDTGARYHLVHSVVLLALGALASGQEALGRSRMGTAAILFAAGMILFSGSLYVLVLTGQTWLGAITPLGGVCWIVAWVMVAFAVPRRQRPLSDDLPAKDAAR